MPKMKNIPTPRAIGNLIPRDAIDDLGPEPISRRRSATEEYRKLLNELLPQVNRLADRLVHHLESLRFASQGLREQTNFTSRFRRSERRARVQARPGIMADGQIDRIGEDGEAEMGVNQGWSRQAMQAASAFLYTNLFETAERPYTIQARGDKAENATLEKMGIALIEELLRRGNFRGQFRKMLDKLPKHGTAVIRYETIRKAEFRRLRFNGVFEESISEIVPVITLWPIDAILVTDLNRSDAADQEGVFWVTDNTTLARIESQEAVFDRGEDRAVLVVVGGKFRNLESLRQELSDSESINVPFENTGRDELLGNVDPDDPDSVSSFPNLTLMEYEGALPMSAMVRQGFMTPQVAEIFGIDVGMDPDPDNDVEMEEWGRKLDKIAVFNVAYTIEAGARKTSNRHLLRLEPARQKTPRNSMYVFRYATDDEDFYGQSVVDLGYQLEKSGDMLRNIQLYVNWRNAHPTWGADLTGLRRRNLDELEKLITEPDRVIQLQSGAKVNDVLQPFFLQVDVSSLETAIGVYKFEFEQATGVSAVQKGTGRASTRTLGELNLNEAKSQNLLLDVFYRMHLELQRLLRDMISDAEFFRTPDELATYLVRISGLPASEIAAALVSLGQLSGLEDEYVFDHPLSSTEDRQVVATQMMKLFQIAGEALFTNPRIAAFGKKILEVSGFPKVDQLGLEPPTQMKPSDEHVAMSQGQFVRTSEFENSVHHLAQHKTFLRVIESGSIDIGMAEEEIQSLKVLLPIHIEETETIVTIQQAQQENQARQANEGVGGGGGGGLQNIGRIETDTIPADADQLRAIATRQAGANLTG